MIIVSDVVVVFVWCMTGVRDSCGLTINTLVRKLFLLGRNFTAQETVKCSFPPFASLQERRSTSVVARQVRNVQITLCVEVFRND